MLGLTRAVEETTATLERGSPGAFRYRQADLRYAVERELYSRLGGRQDLLDAFAAGDQSPKPAKTAVEADVIGRLLNSGGSLTQVGPPLIRRTARSLRWKLAPPARSERWKARPEDLPAGEAGETAPVAFVLDHPKFLTFLEPILAELGDPPPLVISLVPGVDARPTPVPLRHICAYRSRSLPRPDMRQGGRGLAESWYLCSNFELLDAIIAHERPRATVVVEGNSAFDEITNRVCRQRAIPCLCIQQGWSPIAHNGFRNMSFSAMLTWGEGFAELLRPHNPGQRFEVTGSPVFDRHGEGSLALQRLRAETGGRPAVAVFLQGESPLISRHDRESLMRIAAEVAHRVRQVSVLVREHPGHPLTRPERDALGAIPNVILASPDRYFIDEVLEVSTVSLSIYSTTLLESAACGRVPVVFNPTALSRSNPDVEALGAGVEHRDASEVVDAIVRLVQDDAVRASFEDGMTAFADRFFDGARPGAAGRIRAAIDSAVAA